MNICNIIEWAVGGTAVDKVILISSSPGWMIAIKIMKRVFRLCNTGQARRNWLLVQSHMANFPELGN